MPARQPDLPQLDSTFGHRPYRAAGPNAALSPALSHRREDRNAIAARWRPATSIAKVVKWDSHNYLLGMPILENSDCDNKRSPEENISQRAAIVFNIGYWSGRDPIQGSARRIAKMLGEPMLIIGPQDRITELMPRYGSIRMNITGLLRGVGVGERIALQQAVDYTRKDADAGASPPLSGTFPANIRERR